MVDARGADQVAQRTAFWATRAMKASNGDAQV